MKIKIFMVTYKGHKRLLPTLTSLFNSDVVNHDWQVSLINNHTDIRVPDIFSHRPELDVLHNTLRPDFSCGHLSRNWNQALVNGFKSLTNPDCDVVVCSQDDSIFHPEWASRLEAVMQRYDFVHGGHGDQFHAYTPEAVRKVGLWDERFCGLTRQAADYFFRCLMYNKDNSTINDPGHSRVHNPLFPDVAQATSFLVDPDIRKIDDNMGHIPIDADISLKLLHEKYGFDPYPWSQDLFARIPARTRCTNYINYPYFEKDVYNLREKGYLV